MYLLMATTSTLGCLKNSYFIIFFSLQVMHEQSSRISPCKYSFSPCSTDPTSGCTQTIRFTLYVVLELSRHSLFTHLTAFQKNKGLHNFVRVRYLTDCNKICHYLYPPLVLIHDLKMWAIAFVWLDQKSTLKYKIQHSQHLIAHKAFNRLK